MFGKKDKLDLSQQKRQNANTTIAQTETITTNNGTATTFNSRTSRVTYQQSNQTVTHNQTVGMTVLTSRYTPTKEEIEEMLKSSGKSFATIQQEAFQDKKKSTFVNVTETTVTQKSESAFQQKEEIQRVSSATWNKDAINKDKIFATRPQMNEITKYTSPYKNRQISTATTKTTPRTVTANTGTIPKTRATTTTTTTTTPSKVIPKIPKSKTTTQFNVDARPFGAPISSSISSTSSTPNLSTPTPTSTPSEVGKKSWFFKNSSKTVSPGYVYIFNCEEFDNPNVETRVGSAADVKALRDTFESFKFKIKVSHNPKMKDISSVVNEIKKKDFSEHACLVITLLSHGGRHEKIMAKDGLFEIDKDVLFPILTNSTLKGKPKIFIVQACKGDMEIGDVYKDAGETIGAPDEILKCFSTFEGFAAYRGENGSFFIQTLCDKIKLHGQFQSIEWIMKEVTEAVKNKSEGKQIPAMTTTMTKSFVFGHYTPK